MHRAAINLPPGVDREKTEEKWGASGTKPGMSGTSTSSWLGWPGMLGGKRRPYALCARPLARRTAEIASARPTSNCLDQGQKSAVVKLRGNFIPFQCPALSMNSFSCGRHDARLADEAASPGPSRPVSFQTPRDTVRVTVSNLRLAHHVTGEKALTDEVVRSRAKLLTLQILPCLNQPLSTPISDRSLSSGKMFKR